MRVVKPSQTRNTTAQADKTKMAKKVLLVSTSAGQMPRPPRVDGATCHAIDAMPHAASNALSPTARRSSPASRSRASATWAPASLLRVDGVTVSAQVEEDQVGQTEAVKPFSGSNEQGLTGKGGKYSKGDPWTSHVVVSGNLVTGQNPQSAEAFAQAVVKALA